MFVYKIYNTVNDLFYIGISRGKYKPKKLLWLKTNVKEAHCNGKLKEDVISLGRECFRIQVLIETEDENELLDCYDIYFPKNHYEMDKSYNINKHYKSNGLCLKSNETRHLMSIVKKGILPPDDVILKRAIGNRERFADYKEKGIPSNHISCKPYLIYLNEWYYFPMMTKGLISKIIGAGLGYITELYGDLLNTGEPLKVRCKRFNGLIIYNDYDSISKILDSIDYQVHFYKDYIQEVV